MYVTSTDPLPQNSGMAVPRGPLVASDARRGRAWLASRHGRERVYSTLPAAVELWAVSPGLAVDANQILGQSELARQSVLIGVGLPQPVGNDAAVSLPAAPVVFSLNGSSTGSTSTTLATTQNGTMPAPAPVQGAFGLWQSKRQNGASGKHLTTPESVQRPGRGFQGPQVIQSPNVGPGCRYTSPVFQGSQSLATYPLPVPAPQPPSPQTVTANRGPVCKYSRCTVHLVASPTAANPNHMTALDDPTGVGPRVEFQDTFTATQYYNSQGISVLSPGLSGYAPAWGDAWADTGRVETGNDASGGWWLLAAAVGAVGAMGWFGRKGRGR